MIVLLFLRRGRTAKAAADVREAQQRQVLEASDISRQRFEEDLSDLLPDEIKPLRKS